MADNLEMFLGRAFLAASNKTLSLNDHTRETLRELSKSKLSAQKINMAIDLLIGKLPIHERYEASVLVVNHTSRDSYVHKMGLELAMDNMGTIEPSLRHSQCLVLARESDDKEYQERCYRMAFQNNSQLPFNMRGLALTILEANTRQFEKLHGEIAAKMKEAFPRPSMLEPMPVEKIILMDLSDFVAGMKALPRAP